MVLMKFVLSYRYVSMRLLAVRRSPGKEVPWPVWVLSVLASTFDMELHTVIVSDHHHPFKDAVELCSPSYCPESLIVGKTPPNCQLKEFQCVRDALQMLCSFDRHKMISERKYGKCWLCLT